MTKVEHDVGGAGPGVSAIERVAATQPKNGGRRPEELMAELERRGLRVEEVAGVSHPLLVRGRLGRPGVALVGARAADPYGLALAHELARVCAGTGLAVLSGGAEGCDRAAHEGALEAGGETVVVLPAGHDHAYPRHHARLYDRVVAHGGAVVSTYWPTVPIARHRFLARNRTLAELARAVVVVRAHARSGSLSTAASARALGRPLGAVPGAIGEALSEGAHRLLEGGAVPIVGPRSLERWLGAVGLEVRPSGRRWPTRMVGQPAPWAPGACDPRVGAREEDELGGALDAEEAKVMGVLVGEPGLDLDAIAVRSGFPIEVLAGVLLGLELRGALERMPGGRYRPTGRGV